MARAGIFATDLSERSSHPQDARMRTSLVAQAAYFIRFPSPLLIASLLSSALVARLALAHFAFLDLILAAAVGIWWPFQEWLFHKYLLHAKPIQFMSLRYDPMFARAHRAHHRRPWIVETTMLPPGVVLALIPTTIFLWIAATPTLPLACTGVVAYSAMALLYEWTHYLTHSAYEPRSQYYRRIWTNHRSHHFKNPRLWFGFTVPLVDRVLHTDPGSD
jgi:hypothetical protein